MSPLRRFLLAWFGNPLIPCLAAAHLLTITGLVLLALTAGGDARGRPPSPMPMVVFLALPAMLGFKLRILLGDAGAALCERQARWALRGFFVLILPALVASLVAPLLIVGRSALPAIAMAMLTTAAGAWFGFDLKSLRTAACLTLAMVTQALVDMEGVAWWLDLAAIAAIAVSAGGALLAWRRLARHPWQDQPRPHPLIEGIARWIEARTGGRTVPGSAHPGVLPTLGTVVKLAWHGPSASWTARGVVFLGLLATSYIPTRSGGAADVILFLAGVVPMIAFLLCTGWTSGGKMAQPRAPRIFTRSLLANDRLLPLSRRASALATILAHALHSMNYAVPAALGMAAGIGLAAWQQGTPADPMALALLAPYAAVCSFAVAAGYILLHLLPISVAVGGGVVVGGLLTVLPGPLIASVRIPYNPVAFVLLIALVAALALVPFAWRRLADAELP